MAQVAPFRALRYNPEKIRDIRQVVTPPYDVISSKRQEQFYQASPHNIIRLDLNRKRESDTSQDNPYSRAAEHLRNWMDSGVLTRDPQPAFYLPETTYQNQDGQPVLRRGFLTLLRVEDYSPHAVLPHEKTFSGTKEDRLKLLKAVGANISPIFALYPDDDNQVQKALDAARNPEPLNDLDDPDGHHQTLYTMTDPQACAQVARLMRDKVIFIADGHHRYETALAYRDYMRQQYPDAPPNAAFNYVMVYLCSMSDPGLTVLACHRLLPHLDGFDSRDFLALAKPYFDAVEIPTDGDLERAQARLLTTLNESGQRAASFGLASTESSSFFVLTLKNGTLNHSAWNKLPSAMKDLDVEVFTNMVLEHILGLDNQARDREHLISYRSDTTGVIDEVVSGQARLVFLLNPTRVDQVKAVAEAGLIMPRKSTYFYPKVLTGLTMNLVDPAETIPPLLD